MPPRSWITWHKSHKLLSSFLLESLLLSDGPDLPRQIYNDSFKLYLNDLVVILYWVKLSGPCLLTEFGLDSGDIHIKLCDVITHPCPAVNSGSVVITSVVFVVLITGLFYKNIIAWVDILGLMMTSSYGNIFRVTGPLCGEFIGLRWIPRTKASDAELWCFLWSAPE